MTAATIVQARRPTAFVVPVAVGVGATIALAPTAATFSVAALLALALVVLPTRTLGAPREVGFWTVASFVVHLGIGLVIAHASNAIDYFGIDARYYHLSASELADHWANRGPAPLLATGKEGFTYLIAALYWFGGPLIDAGILVNAGLAAALTPVIWWTTRSLFGDEAAARVPVLLMILPGLLIWPAQLLREAAIFVLLAGVAAIGASLSRRTRPWSLALLAGMVALLFTFRGPVALLVAAGVLLSLVLARRGRPAGLVTGVTAGGLLLAFILSLGLGATGFEAARNVDLRQLDTGRRASSESVASGFDSDRDVSSGWRAAAYLPGGLVRFLLGPWPWQVRTLRQVPALVDAIAWWLMLPALLRGVRLAWRDRTSGVFVLVVPAALLAAGLALGVGNFGTVVRLRTQVLVLLLPIIAAGLRPRRHTRTLAA